MKFLSLTIRCSALALALIIFAPAKSWACEDHDHSKHQHTAQEVDDAGDPPASGSIYWLEGTWSTDRNESITLRSFEGKPVLLTMMFTSCKQACPILVEDLKRVQAGLREDERTAIQFVVVSIDPERDTPAVTAAFKKKIKGATAWTFLTGTPDQVMELAGVLGVRYKKIGDDYVHSNKLTVLNAKGEIAHQTLGLRAPAGETVEAVRKVLGEGK